MKLRLPALIACLVLSAACAPSSAKTASPTTVTVSVTRTVTTPPVRLTEPPATRTLPAVTVQAQASTVTVLSTQVSTMTAPSTQVPAACLEAVDLEARVEQAMTKIIQTTSRAEGLAVSGDTQGAANAMGTALELVSQMNAVGGPIQAFDHYAVACRTGGTP